MFIVSHFIVKMSAGENCYITESRHFEYCEHGCCGNKYEDFCCMDADHVLLLASGIVGGGVLLIILFNVIVHCWFTMKRKQDHLRRMETSRSTTCRQESRL